MKDVENWEVGQVFVSTRMDNDAFVVADISATSEQKFDSRGKPKPVPHAYVLGRIPESVEYIMPSGSIWVHNRKSFFITDDLIRREISIGNWVAVE